jgi:alanine racemase
MHRPLWIEINLKAVEKNLELVKKIVGPDTKILATIKQDAYGHGLLPIAKKLSEVGIDFFGVGSLEEAIDLRNNGLKEPILILSTLFPHSIKALIDYRARPTITDFKFASILDREARRRGRVIPIHIKVDTGMGRLGIWYTQAERFLQNIKNLRNLLIEGIFTHFPVADTDPAFTKNQIMIFNNLINRLALRGIQFRYIHCANSIGLIRYREAHFNLVRPGLILYGINPQKKSLKLRLKPLLSLKSKVIFLKKVGRGRSISYGRTYITKRPTLIATIACGYADGYPWSLSNKGRVIIEEKVFPVVGRVCMDHIMVDVRDYKGVKVGSTATLIGGRGRVRLRAEDLAQWANTIPYEIVSRLSSKIPRIYKN